MDILIRGMEMPKDTCEMRITIDQDGDWWAMRLDIDDEWHEVVKVPTPHGRLIDADAEITVWDMGYDGAPHIVKTTVSCFILGHLNGAIPPTIIEAEGDE